MTAATRTRYVEQTVRLAQDPLLAAAGLAAAEAPGDHVLYERQGRWSFAAGALADLSLDASGARLRLAPGLPGPAEQVLPWDGTPPLELVRELLARIPVEGWRAYGWAAFELAYAKDGGAAPAPGQRLLHLVVPDTEVRLEAGVAHLRAADPERLAEVARRLAHPGPAPAGPSSSRDVRGTGAGEYERVVGLAVAEINSHELQKVILSRRVLLDHPVDLVGTYVQGRQGNTPARSFLLRLDGLEAAGFSPEIVVRVDRDGRVISQPLAGTRALTPDADRNLDLRGELMSDPKEIFEHAVSVKTAVDELRAVCEPGSVAVREFMTVRERGTVQHLASQVEGKLAAGLGPWDAFGAAFPAVTASGIPKVAAYASIRRHEDRPRGLYAGAVLTVGEDGELDAALVLRTVYRQDGQTWLQAGAGIVGQSLPPREFEETCEKLDSVARFLVGPAARGGSDGGSS